MKFNLAETLKKAGVVGDVSVQGKKIKKIIKIELKYKDGKPLVGNLKRISKQGQRIYIKKNDLRSVRQGYGIAIISTSRGLMTNVEAKKKGMGGEVICEVW